MPNSILACIGGRSRGDIYGGHCYFYMLIKSRDNWIHGKHALITGASSGIGRQIAVRLVASCRKLTLISRNTAGALTEVVAELEALKVRIGSAVEIVALSADIQDAGAAEKIVGQIYAGGNDQVDAFVNCAGGSHTFGLLESMSAADIAQIIDINAKAPIFWLKEILPRMRAHVVSPGDMKRGHVLMLSSRSGERALPNLSVYAAAKGCIEKLIEAVRNEYAAHRIAFTLVNPGSVNTSFTQHWPEAPRNAHNAESMTVDEAVGPIITALEGQFVVNRLSYQSVGQWTAEPGVLRAE